MASEDRDMTEDVPTLRTVSVGPITLAFSRFSSPSVPRDYPIVDGWRRVIDEGDHKHYGAALALRIGWTVYEVEGVIAPCEVRP